MESIWAASSRSPGFFFLVYFPNTGTCIRLHLIGVTINYAHGGRNRRVPKTGERNIDNAEREAFIDWIAADPVQATLSLAPTGHARCAGAVREKASAGVKVNYFHLTDDAIVLLVIAMPRLCKPT